MERLVLNGDVEGEHSEAMDHLPPEQLAALWARVRGRLQQEVGEVEYRTWLRQMTLVGLDGDEITVHLPTRFLRDWVRAQYGDRLTALWQEVLPSVRRVEVAVGHGGGTGLAESVSPPPRPTPGPIRAAEARPNGDGKAAPQADDRAEASAPLDPRFTFDSFVVGKPNEFAHACARRVAEKPASQGFNPLFLYGGVGLGKTHLMHAIAWELTAQDRPGGPVTVAYMSAEKFMYRFISAIRSQATIQFKEQLRSVDVLMIDDLQFLINKDATQEEFFHTFNYLFEGRKQIVLSSDQPPSEIAQLEQRLVSRFEWGLTAELQPPDMETRLAILRKKASSLDVQLPSHVLEYLAHRIKSNVRRLEGALLRVASFSSLSGRPLTDDSIEHVLRDILQEEARRAVSIDQVQRKVAEHYDVRLADMTSKRRPANIAFPRQIAMFISRRLTKSSLQDIGEAFGGRDHGTVIHACKTVQDRMDKEESLRQIIRFLETSLQR